MVTCSHSVIGVPPLHQVINNAKSIRMSPITKYPVIPKLAARHIAVLAVLMIAYSFFEMNRGFQIKEAKASYEAAIKQDDPAAAIVALDAIMKLDGKNSTCFVNRAYFHEVMDNLQEAIIDYTKALKLEPECHGALIGRGHLYFELTQYEKAISDLSEALRIDNANLVSYRLRGASYSQLEMQKNAFADFAKALKLAPKDGMTYFARGTAHERVEQYDLALNDFASAMKYTPRLARYCYQARACIFDELGQAKLADAERRLGEEHAHHKESSDTNTELVDQELADDFILSQIASKGGQLNTVRRIHHKFCVKHADSKQLANALKMKGLTISSDANSPSSSGEALEVWCHEQIAADKMPQRTKQLIKLADEFGAQYCGWGTK